jgi:hypothetical protein
MAKWHNGATVQRYNGTTAQYFIDFIVGYSGVRTFLKMSKIHHNEFCSFFILGSDILVFWVDFSEKGNHRAKYSQC